MPIEPIRICNQLSDELTVTWEIQAWYIICIRKRDCKRGEAGEGQRREELELGCNKGLKVPHAIGVFCFLELNIITICSLCMSDQAKDETREDVYLFQNSGAGLSALYATALSYDCKQAAAEKRVTVG